ncbi:helix-turn-helix transcriptional regulator [Pseudoxanthomonas koreensis]|uniref:helix-turn-helix transcriptional regulator n=1 Tax=Pseudoxanthomonas koreensis TaxID=266061 RepID=UPI001391AFCF|nr:helix-turn-helix transcriptional regulator [Pseudoxanthomonas koreensis]KAF1697175.1 transcriptional regulator [Pseudoxanthomonas koreensis]
MDKEKAEFAARLRAALEAKGIEASAAVVEKRFNSRYDGAAVTAQAVSGWLNGKSIPKQDKLRVLAALVGLEPHELQFGGKHRVGDARAEWPASLPAQDRVMMDAYLRLPVMQRKLVRELVAVLARAGGSGG